MKLYIVDDDATVIKMIEEIILDNALGEIVGMNTNSKQALEEVRLLKPDLVLVDLLMPELDGITFVEQISQTSSHIKSIMISQVTSKKIVGDAYEKGITFFVGKPINKKELTHVILNVADQIKLESSMMQIKSLLEKGNTVRSSGEQSLENDTRKYRLVFSKLGILGESGCDDIIKICDYLKQNMDHVHQERLNEITAKVSDNSKAMEQRIRRTINKGMSNVASLGIEDYLNETFVKFSNSLFDFDQVRLEMEFIRRKTNSGGKINIRKFMDNLLLIVEEM